jgi:hypothetical protein
MLTGARPLLVMYTEITQPVETIFHAIHSPGRGRTRSSFSAVVVLTTIRGPDESQVQTPHTTPATPARAPIAARNTSTQTRAKSPLVRRDFLVLVSPPARTRAVLRHEVQRVECQAAPFKST